MDGWLPGQKPNKRLHDVEQELRRRAGTVVGISSSKGEKGEQGSPGADAELPQPLAAADSPTFAGLGIGQAAVDGVGITVSHTTGGASLPPPLTGTLFHLAAANSTITRILLESWGTNSQIIGRRASGTIGSPQALTANQGITGITAMGHDGTNYGTGGRASVLFCAAENWTASANGTYMDVYVTANGTTTVAAKLRVHNNGDFAMLSGGKMYLDGIAGTGDTYILESAANVLDLYAGGVKALNLTANGTTIAGNFGCNGAAAQGKYTVNAALNSSQAPFATLLAATASSNATNMMVNQIRAALIANGICV